MNYLKELERLQEPIDPLVIVLNKHQYWYKDGFKLCCCSSFKIDKNLFSESDEINDNPYIYNKYKILTCKIKYAKIQFKD